MKNYTYEHIYMVLKGHHSIIIESIENQFILWENPSHTARYVDYFYKNGNFKKREVIKLS